MNTYTFYWLDGTREILIGETPLDAFQRGGYGHGAIRALDCYVPGDDRSYSWDGRFWVEQVDVNLKKA